MIFRKQSVEDICKWRRDNEHKPITSVRNGIVVRGCYNDNNGGKKNGLLQRSGRHVQKKGGKI